jgi:uncharacterized protein (UPF0335 family)
MTTTHDAEAISDTLHHRKVVGDNSIAADRLRSLVDRIERLSEEKTALSSDITDIFKEAASAGFDKKVLRRLIADRKHDVAEVEEAETLLSLYRRALEGMRFE